MSRSIFCLANSASRTSDKSSCRKDCVSSSSRFLFKRSASLVRFRLRGLEAYSRVFLDIDDDEVDEVDAFDKAVVGIALDEVRDNDEDGGTKALTEEYDAMASNTSVPMATPTAVVVDVDDEDDAVVFSLRRFDILIFMFMFILLLE